LSNTFDPYAAIEQQRAIGRVRRRAAGADTTYDDAEARHDAIHGYLLVAKFLGPVAFAATVGWIGLNPVVGWCISAYGAVAVYLVATLCAAFAHGLLEAFHPNAGHKTLHALMQAGGAGILVLGAAVVSLGAVLTGACLIATPPLWRRWERRVMANTDFARLRRARTEPSPPQILE
jgi:hypothetical protein